jgi:competence protein ComEC
MTSQTSLARSAPFAVLAAALAAGIWLTDSFSVPLAWGAGALLIFTTLLVIASHGENATAIWLFALLASLSLGALRYAIAQPNLIDDPLVTHHGQSVIVEGLIVDEPDVRATHVNLRIRPQRVVASGSETRFVNRSPLQSSPLQSSPLQSSPLLLIRADKSTTWRYGEAIRAFGIIDAPFISAEFDYRAYLARKGIATWMPRPDRVEAVEPNRGNPFWANLYALKDALRRASQRIMPSPESALLNGILIGDDNEIPPHVQEAFRRTGTSHIVAISGFNVSIVIALVVPMLSRLLNKRRAALVAIPAIVLYVLLVGASASVVRAGVMAILALIGQLLWRRGFTLNTLCAAAFIMLLIDPQTLFDAGFQLSFAATLGLVLYSDKLESALHRSLANTLRSERMQKLVGALSGLILVTLAAQITTLPLLLNYFNQLSLVTLPANVLVLPLQPPAMILGAAASVFGAITHSLPALQPLASVLAWPAYAFLTLTLRIIEWMGTLAFASVPVYGFGEGATAAYYAALLVVTSVIAQPQDERGELLGLLRRRMVRNALLAGLLVLAVMGGVWWYQRPDGKLHVVFSGGGAFVQTPAGQQLVFAGSTVLAPMGRAMPVWDRQIEWLILPQRDDRARADALPLVQRYAIGQLILPAGGNEPDEPSDMLAAWDEAMQKQTVLVIIPNIGHEIELEPNLKLTTHRHLGGAIGLKLVYGDVVFDLLGGARPIHQTLSQEAVLFMSPRHADAEKLNTIAPRWVVWADVGGRAPTGLAPAIKALALKDAGVVEFVSDGKSLTVRQ